MVFVGFQDPECRSFFCFYRLCSNCYVGPTFNMSINHIIKIHLVELVAGKDQCILIFMCFKMVHTLADRICSPLKPSWVIGGLFCCKDIYKCFTEKAE